MEVYLMAHVAKFKAGATGHMFAHYDRSVGLRNGNQEINHEKSELNYNLAVHQDLRQNEFLKKRLSEIKVQNRKDLNVFCDWVVTAPKDFTEDNKKNDLELFFKKTYEFLENRYGKENIISSYVHMDENTPHMHFAFIPVAIDKRKGGYKLSAKDVLTRNDLRTLHSDLSVVLAREFGYDVGVLNHATELGNKSVQELKKQSLKEIDQQIELKIEELKLLDDEIKKLAEIMQKCYQDNIWNRKLNVKISKKMFSDEKIVSIPEKNYNDMLMALYTNKYFYSDIMNVRQYLKEARFERSSEKIINELKDKRLEVNQLKSKVQNLQNKNDILQIKVNYQDKVLDRVDRLIDNMSNYERENFLDKLYPERNNKNYELDYEYEL